MQLFRLSQLRIETGYKIANCSAINKSIQKHKKDIFKVSDVGMMFIKFQAYSFNTKIRKKEYLGDYRVCMGTL